MPRTTREHRDHLKHPCYPVQEFGGLVFAYMGPLEKMPELPKYDAWIHEGGKYHARFGPRIGGSVDCNWLQTEENLMDALHTVWLHTLHSGSQFPTQVFTSLPEELRYEETEMGMRFVIQKLDGGRWALGNGHAPERPPGLHERAQDNQVNQVSFCVPVDDTHVRSANIRWMPADEDETLLSGRAKLAPGGGLTRATSIASATPTTRKPRKAWAKSPTIGSSITSPRMKAC